MNYQTGIDIVPDVLGILVEHRATEYVATPTKLPGQTPRGYGETAFEATLDLLCCILCGASKGGPGAMALPVVIQLLSGYFYCKGRAAGESTFEDLRSQRRAMQALADNISRLAKDRMLRETMSKVGDGTIFIEK